MGKRFFDVLFLSALALNSIKLGCSARIQDPMEILTGLTGLMATGIAFVIFKNRWSTETRLIETGTVQRNGSTIVKFPMLVIHGSTWVIFIVVIVCAFACAFINAEVAFQAKQGNLQPWFTWPWNPI